ncbi:DMSO/TMAO reductase YedYZ molybdopterin-dependent catalytic subunit [Streptomyces sp. V3I8]|uniref:sulfite oxidase n=1 Tax=Streptomyces sp. V3I8 TaxID=3042279 RepID=UPI002787A960|nr:sulfite oxidase [Streptomyces sp. V3I8]MDQ1034186.1 DMSO/TMAO reductase YedYZ molybdopterin-dependent catalytic subunit [Streptomyces sp. V3I8]
MTDDEKQSRITHNGVRPALGALSGLLAGFAALAVAALAAALVRPQAGPVIVVGGAAIDRTPTPVKDWAVRNFGTDDKLVLQLGILAVLVLFAIGLGVLALRYRRSAAAGVLLFGVVGAAAAISRPDSAGFTDALPSVVGAVVAAGVLFLLAATLRTAASGPCAPSGAGRAGSATAGTAAEAGTESGSGPSPEPGWDRRGFVITATAVAAASAGAGLLGRALSGSTSRDAVASRAGVTLPVPASRAAAIPAGARLRIAGVSPFVTPNKDFYRVDTALVVPKVDAAAWRLRIHGDGVQRPLTLTFDDLLRRELIERDITLTCVSNEVGGSYAGTARWIGVHLAGLLAECGVRPPSRGGRADQLVARSVDGMTIGSPVEDVMDGRDALLAVGMNGRPLPFEHGFPARMVVPGLYGYVSACKWIEDIELTSFDSYDAYWVKRKWAREAPVKTQSRIDTPKPFARPKAGPVMVAGVAWAQHRGIDKVEVRIDDGPWQEARLAAEDSRDTWRQWSYDWRATRGGHTLTVRATDRTGEVQTAKRTGTVPDGASGRHSVVVSVD